MNTAIIIILYILLQHMYIYMKDKRQEMEQTVSSIVISLYQDTFINRTLSSILNDTKIKLYLFGPVYRGVLMENIHCIYILERRERRGGWGGGGGGGEYVHT